MNHEATVSAMGFFKNDPIPKIVIKNSMYYHSELVIFMLWCKIRKPDFTKAKAIPAKEKREV